MLSRQQLEIINRKSLRYPLHIAEKDYLLALVLQLISNSPLSKKLVFKGGTAVHHCYLEQYRFSEDLDFSSDQQHVSYEEVQEVLTSVDFLEIKKHYQSNATIKIERLLYTGPLGHPNSVKVEIDFLQNVLLPVKRLPYRTAWGLEFPVRVMDLREICAEKIRAMSDRARYRDFYDMYLILETHRVDLKEVTGYVQRKEIRQPISKVSISKNWRIAKAEKVNEKQTIYQSRPVEDQLIEEMISSLPFDEIA
jgi:predicted nucleotidyltransferase component of viral defense system